MRVTNKGQYQREREVVVAHSSGSPDSFAGSVLDEQMSTLTDSVVQLQETTCQAISDSNNNNKPLQFQVHEPH